MTSSTSRPPARGIWVANVPDYCADEVADHTVLLLMAAARRLDQAAGPGGRSRGGWCTRSSHRSTVHRSGRWASWAWAASGPGSPAGARLRLERHRGRRRDAPRAVIRERGAEPVSVDELFRRADAIALHCPLSEETHHLVDAARLATTRPGVDHRQHVSRRPHRHRGAGRGDRVGPRLRRRPGRAGGRASPGHEPAHLLATQRDHHVAHRVVLRRCTPRAGAAVRG